MKNELNLTGRRVEEALALLDKFLDDASLSALSPLRIIHGLGTGRLRAAIRKFLETHPQVEGFSEAGEREGGGGATVVRLRL
jgi:DNA mismatch repair protein MutS2